MKFTWYTFSLTYIFSFSSLLMRSPLTQLPRLSPPQKRVNLKLHLTAHSHFKDEAENEDGKLAAENFVGSNDQQ
jgi:hypothetical protein